MDKYELLILLGRNIKNLKIISNNSRSNPIFEIKRENKTNFFTICESGGKDKKARDSLCIWCTASKISKEIIMDKDINLENIFFIVIDFKPLEGEKPRFILARLDETNYLSHGKDYSFNFNRPDYNGFFNTNSVEELIKKL